MRVLDIDLDFFVAPPRHWPGNNQRAVETEHTVWPIADALTFLRDRCRLDQRHTGALAETHDEVFFHWKAAIRSGQLPVGFHVTHLDAHADQGMGDAGWRYLFGELLHAETDDRDDPVTGLDRGLNETNFLLFAIACRWLSSLEYVFGDGGGNDELVLALEGLSPRAGNIQLSAYRPEDLDRLLRGPVEPVRFEPPVPYRASHHRDFQAEDGYDMVFLTRSPLYTPASADKLFDAIVEEFIDVAV